MARDDVFEPVWASPPGDTIKGLLKRKEIAIEELAEIAGVSSGVIEDLLVGATKLTRSLAEALSATIGGSTAFWLKREEQYRDDLTRRHLLVEATEIEWTAELPISEMINFGWIANVPVKQRLEAALAFFGVGSIAEWRQHYGGLASAVSFRTSPIFSSRMGAVLAWLRQGEIQAGLIERKPWNVDALKSALPKMRALTRLKQPADFMPKLQRLCADAGVALVVVPAPKACKASGATWFDSKGAPICLLSHRYGSDDQFWFTLFHEMGHLVLHSDRALFLEDGEQVIGDDEAQADRFAQGVLLPEEFIEEMASLPLEYKSVIQFSRKIGVSAGIVVGQMQHRKLLPYNWLNKVKRRYDWKLT